MQDRDRRERGQGRGTGRSPMDWFPPKCPRYSGTDQAIARSSRSVWVSQLSVRDPNTWAATSCLSMCSLAGSWNQKWSRDSKTDTPTQEMDIPVPFRYYFAQCWLLPLSRETRVSLEHQTRVMWICLLSTCHSLIQNVSFAFTFWMWVDNSPDIPLWFNCTSLMASGIKYFVKYLLAISIFSFIECNSGIFKTNFSAILIYSIYTHVVSCEQCKCIFSLFTWFMLSSNEQIWGSNIFHLRLEYSVPA